MTATTSQSWTAISVNVTGLHPATSQGTRWYYLVPPAVEIPDQFADRHSAREWAARAGALSLECAWESDLPQAARNAIRRHGLAIRLFIDRRGTAYSP